MEKKTATEFLRNCFDGNGEFTATGEFGLRIITEAMESYKTQELELQITKEWGWISVSERLPEIGEYVLLHLDSSTIIMGMLMSNGWCANFSDCGIAGIGSRSVKNWQPLPTLPSPPTPITK